MGCFNTTNNYFQGEKVDNELIVFEAAYPNPFNPSTTIEYNLPKDISAYVNLSIYDVRGRLVTELVNESQKDSVENYKIVWNADKMASGLYFVKLTVGDVSKNQKIMLIK